MAKEITHILIAGQVTRHLKRSGLRRLAHLISENSGGLFLGATIPDALYYDVPPFRLNPLKHIWIAQNLHQDRLTDNETKAAALFRTVSARPPAWKLKLAFAAGVMTHTVVDRVFHETIDQTIAGWGETGAEAQATHREMETLIDLLFLKQVDMSPRQFLRDYPLQLSHKALLRLCQLYLELFAQPEQGPRIELIHVLKRANLQQRIFLQLFTMRPLHLAVNRLNRLASGRLKTWNSLFYPDRANPFHFPVLYKLGIQSHSGSRPFVREVIRLRDLAVAEAAASIQWAVGALL
jgi:hypothetical protein